VEMRTHASGRSSGLRGLSNIRAAVSADAILCARVCSGPLDVPASA
jgi:hypothetical protein